MARAGQRLRSTRQYVRDTTNSESWNTPGTRPPARGRSLRARRVAATGRTGSARLVAAPPQADQTPDHRRHDVGRPDVLRTARAALRRDEDPAARPAADGPDDDPALQ